MNWLDVWKISNSESDMISGDIVNIGYGSVENILRVVKENGFTSYNTDIDLA